MRNWIGMASVLAVGLAASSASAQDATKGEHVFATQCKACHTLNKGGSTNAGPNLYRIMGRKSGTGTGYGYSEVMRRFSIEWDDKTLASYLRDPKGDMPGTKMVFAGMKQPGQIADLIAYLKVATQ